MTVQHTDPATAEDRKATIAAESLLSELEAAQARLVKVRSEQIALARALYERSAGSALRTIRDRFDGMAAGAGLSLQVLLVALGEVEYDEGAEPTWDVVMGEEGTDGR